MGLLDKFKDQAGNLIDSAKDKVSEATGLDVDKGLDVANSTLEGGKSAVEAVDSFSEAKDRLFGKK
jgi:hypothetical protein